MADFIESSSEARAAREAEANVNSNIIKIGDRTFIKISGLRPIRQIREEREVREMREAREERQSRAFRIPRLPREEKWVEIKPEEMQEEQQDTAFMDMTDPKANTSFLGATSNVFFNEQGFIWNPFEWVYNAVDNFIWDINGDGKDSLIKNMFVDPFTYSDSFGEGLGATGLNILMGVGTDADFIANPIKGFIDDGWRGFKRGLGVTGEGRYIYNFDFKTGNTTGDFFANMAAEIFVSIPTMPISLVGVGVRATSALSKQTLKATIKKGVKEIVKTEVSDLSSETIKQLGKNVSKLEAINIIKAFGEEAVQNALKQTGKKPLTKVSQESADAALGRISKTKLMEQAQQLLEKELYDEVVKISASQGVELALKASLPVSAAQIKSELTQALLKSTGKKYLTKEERKFVRSQAQEIIAKKTPPDISKEIIAQAEQNVLKRTMKAVNKWDPDYKDTMELVTKNSFFRKALSSTAQDISKSVKYNKMTAQILDTVKPSVTLGLRKTSRALGKPGRAWNKYLDDPLTRTVLKIYASPFRGASWLVGRAASLPDLALGKVTPARWLKYGTGIVQEIKKGTGGIVNSTWAFLTRNAVKRQNKYWEKMYRGVNNIEKLVDLDTRLRTQTKFLMEATKTAKQRYRTNKLAPELGQTITNRIMKERFQVDMVTYDALVKQGTENAREVFKKTGKDAYVQEMNKVQNLWAEYIMKKYELSLPEYLKFLNDANDYFGGTLNDILSLHRVTELTTKLKGALELEEALSGITITGKLKRKDTKTAIVIDRADIRTRRVDKLGQQLKAESDFEKLNKETKKLNNIKYKNLPKKEFEPIPGVFDDPKEIARLQKVYDEFIELYGDVKLFRNFLEEASLFFRHIKVNIPGMDPDALIDCFRAAIYNIGVLAKKSIVGGEEVLAKELAKKWIKEAQNIFNNKYTLRSRLNIETALGDTISSLEEQLAYKLEIYLHSIPSGQKIIPELTSFRKYGSLDYCLDMQAYKKALDEAAAFLKERGMSPETLQKVSGYAEMLPEYLRMQLSDLKEKLANLKSLYSDGDLAGIQKVLVAVNTHTRSLDALIGLDADPILALHSGAIARPFEAQINDIKTPSSRPNFIADTKLRKEKIKEIDKKRELALQEFDAPILEARAAVTAARSQLNIFQGFKKVEDVSAPSLTKTTPPLAPRNFEEEFDKVFSEMGTLEHEVMIEHRKLTPVEYEDYTYLEQLKRDLAEAKKDPFAADLFIIRQSIHSRLKQIFKANNFSLTNSEIYEMSTALTEYSYKRLVRIAETQGVPSYRRASLKKGSIYEAWFGLPKSQAENMLERNRGDSWSSDVAFKTFINTEPGRKFIEIRKIKAIESNEKWSKALQEFKQVRQNIQQSTKSVMHKFELMNEIADKEGQIIKEVYAQFWNKAKAEFDAMLTPTNGKNFGALVNEEIMKQVGGRFRRSNLSIDQFLEKIDKALNPRTGAYSFNKPKISYSSEPDFLKEDLKESLNSNEIQDWINLVYGTPKQIMEEHLTEVQTGEEFNIRQLFKGLERLDPEVFEIPAKAPVNKSKANVKVWIKQWQGYISNVRETLKKQLGPNFEKAIPPALTKRYSEGYLHPVFKQFKTDEEDNKAIIALYNTFLRMDASWEMLFYKDGDMAMNELLKKAGPLIKEWPTEEYKNALYNIFRLNMGARKAGNSMEQVLTNLTKKIKEVKSITEKNVDEVAKDTRIAISKSPIDTDTEVRSSTFTTGEIYNTDEWVPERFTAKRMERETASCVRQVYGFPAWEKFTTGVDSNIKYISDFIEEEQIVAFIKTALDLAENAVIIKKSVRNMGRLLTKHKIELDRVWETFLKTLKEGQTSGSTEYLLMLLEGMQSAPAAIKFSYIQGLYFSNLTEYNSSLFKQVREAMQSTVRALESTPVGSPSYNLFEYLLNIKELKNRDYIPGGISAKYPELKDYGDGIAYRDLLISKELLDSQMDGLDARLENAKHLKHLASMTEEHAFLKRQINELFNQSIKREIDLYTKMLQDGEKDVLPKFIKVIQEHHIDNEEGLKIFTDEDLTVIKDFFYGRNSNDKIFRDKWDTLKDKINVYNNNLYAPEEALEKLSYSTLSFNGRWKRYKTELDSAHKYLTEQLKKQKESGKYSTWNWDPKTQIYSKTGNNPIDKALITLEDFLNKFTKEVNLFDLNYYGADPFVKTAIRKLQEVIKFYKENTGVRELETGVIRLSTLINNEKEFLKLLEFGNNDADFIAFVKGNDELNKIYTQLTSQEMHIGTGFLNILHKYKIVLPEELKHLTVSSVPTAGREDKLLTFLAQYDKAGSEYRSLKSAYYSKMRDFEDTFNKLARDTKLSVMDEVYSQNFANDLASALDGLIKATDDVTQKMKSFEAALRITDKELAVLNSHLDPATLFEYLKNIKESDNLRFLIEHDEVLLAEYDVLKVATKESPRTLILPDPIDPTLRELYTVRNQAQQRLNFAKKLGSSNLKDFENANIRAAQDLKTYKDWKISYLTKLHNFQTNLYNRYLEVFTRNRKPWQMMGILPARNGGKLIKGERLNLSDLHKPLVQRNIEIAKQVQDFTVGNINEILSSDARGLAEHLAFTGPFNFFQLSYLRNNPNTTVNSKLFKSNGRLKDGAEELLRAEGIEVNYIPRQDMMILSLDKKRLSYRALDGQVYLNGEPITRQWTNRHFAGFEKFEQIAEHITGVRLGYSLGEQVDPAFWYSLFTGTDKGFIGLNNLGMQGDFTITQVSKGREAKISTLNKKFGGWSNEDLITNLYMPERRFNEMVYGNSDFLKKFGIYRTTNPIIGAFDRVQDLYMMNKARTNLTLDILDETYTISGNGIFAKFSDQDIADFLDKNQNWMLVVTRAGRGKGQGLRVNPWPTFYGARSVAEARKLNAHLLPVTMYKRLSQTLNNRVTNNKFLHLWHRMHSWYKTLILAVNGLGVVMNNLIDTSLKDYIEGVYEPDAVNPLIAHSIIDEYRDIIHYFKTRPAGAVSGDKAIRELFERQDTGLMVRLNHFKAIDGLDNVSPYEAFKIIDDFFVIGSGGGLLTSFKTSQELNTIMRAKIDKDYRSWLQEFEHTAQERTFEMLSILGMRNEESNRLALFLTALKKDMKMQETIPVQGKYTENLKRTMRQNTVIEDAYGWVRKTHFDYAFKSGVEQSIEYVIPFGTFLMRNLEYWWTVIERHPHILHRLIDINHANWEANDYTPEQLAVIGAFPKPLKFFGLADNSGRDLFLKAEFSSLGDVFDTVFDPWESLKHRIALPFAQVAVNKMTEDYKGQSYWDNKSPEDKFLTAISWLPGTNLAVKIKNLVTDLSDKEPVKAIHDFPFSGATKFQRKPYTPFKRSFEDIKFVRRQQMYRLNPIRFRPNYTKRRFSSAIMQYNAMQNKNSMKAYALSVMKRPKASYNSRVQARKHAGTLYGINVSAFR